MTRLRGQALIFASMGCFLFGQTAPSGPVITSVSNGGSGSASIESGSWVSIYGTGLSATTRAWKTSDFSGTALPTTLDGVSVLIDGKSAAVAYVSPNQLNVQAPTDTATGSVPVQVTSPNGTAAFKATLQNYAPAFFTFQGKYVAARHSDSVVVAAVGFFGSSTTSRPAQPGEVIQIYATGLGPTNPAVPAGQLVSKAASLSDLGQLKVSIGGTPVTVTFAGIVAPGLYQINSTVPSLQDGDQPISATIAGVLFQSAIFIPVKNAVSGTISVTLSPNNRTMRCGATLTLTAKVNNTSNQSVTWQVNGIAGGNATVGTISSAGVYTAPLVLPATPSVQITAVSQQDSTALASVTVNLQNPLPAVSSATPNPINPGSATITVNGSGFANGGVIYLAGHALTTTFVSPTQLTATTTVAMPLGRLAAIKVANPNPGAAMSTPISVPVRVANEKMPYAAAVRFLEMTTWGPTPQSVVDLQTQGQEAWLAAQFAKPASAWPDPNTPSEGVGRLQTAFYNVALSGDDQLRQRASFALAQIAVSSAIKDTTFEQMVSYQRALGDYAFGSYRDFLTTITLNPSMGDFLDMVNNDKANTAAGTSPNENYARESMQLFSLGLVQLDPTGVPLTVDGNTLPEYDQTTVSEMAKVLTGWTYGKTPGFTSLWKNQPYYFGPMVAFENHHDTTQKNLNLPVACTIPAGGTAEADLGLAIDCLFKQANLAPFVSYRLIQRFTISNPSPAYVGRVAAVFQSSQGNLQSVVTAILTDPEVQNEGSGKLNEPILYQTGLLRALNANITAPDALTTQATNMGQTPLSPSSVFSYFSPFYSLSGVTPRAVAPEFQAMNAATALARANFAYRVATNGLSSGIAVDLSNLQDLANNPADLVEALNQALFRGEMDSNVRSILMTAATVPNSTTASRVRSVLYAAAAAPQFEVSQ